MGVVCIILLDRQGFYRPGDLVTGSVRYVVNKTTTFTEASITLKGDGKCKWYESSGDDSSTVVRGSEEYVKVKKYIFKPDANNHNFKVRAGSCDYNFNFLLPEEIPSSFKNKYCVIKYQLLVKYKKPGLFQTSNKFEQEIVVRECYRIDPSVPQGPLMYVLKKSLLQLFGSQNNVVNVRAVIQNPVIRPGESLMIDFTVENNTKINISCIKVELKSKITLTAKGGFKKKAKEIINESTARSTSINRESNATVSLKIPTSPDMYTIGNSKILFRAYKLIVTLKLPAPHLNADMEIPIVIADSVLNQLDYRSESTGNFNSSVPDSTASKDMNRIVMKTKEMKM